MHLHFKAQKATGEFYEGERDAADKYALAREFAASGETLLIAEEAEGATKRLFSLPGFRRVSIHEKAVFARTMGGMVGGGLSLSRALSVLERQTRQKKFKGIIAALNAEIARGVALSEALSKFPDVFPRFFTSMVRAGEEGGNLAGAFASIADGLERTYQLERKIRGAFMYPLVIVVVMLIVGFLMFVYVVPKLTAVFKDFNVDLPFSTRLLIGLSDLLSHHTLLFASLLLGVFALAALFLKTPKGKRILDFLSLRLPGVSAIIREANTARAGQTLSSLLSSGVPVVSALEVTADVISNTYFRDVLLAARQNIQKGEPLSSAFEQHEDIYPPVLSEMIAVGEETGKLSGMLKDTADFFASEVDQKTKDLSTVIEPVLMVLVGAAVGFFAVAMISPAYSLMNSI